MKDTITMSDKLSMAKFVLTSNKFTNGDKVKQFERSWSEWLGAEKSLFVSSGSTANFLLLSAVIEKYNLLPGDKVLVPACTWMTNVAPIIQLGLTPIFCDINLENFSFDKNHMEQISLTHPDIKVIFVTHLLGLPSWDTEYFVKLFPKSIILDDVCESHGVEKYGQKIGAGSLGATFSFYFGHHMTTIEGGMVSTNDEELYDIMKMKRSHGLSRESVNPNKYNDMYPELNSSFLFVTDGYNFRNHEIPAVLGLSQLKRLDDMIKIRRKNYEKYLSLLSQHLDKFYIPSTTIENSSFSFPLVSRNHETHVKLKGLLDVNKIEFRPIVSGNLLRHPFLNSYSLEPKSGEMYNVEIIHKNGLYIGNNHFVGDKELNMLSNVLDQL